MHVPRNTYTYELSYVHNAFLLSSGENPFGDSRKIIATIL